MENNYKEIKMPMRYFYDFLKTIKDFEYKQPVFLLKLTCNTLTFNDVSLGALDLDFFLKYGRDRECFIDTDLRSFFCVSLTNEKETIIMLYYLELVENGFKLIHSSSREVWRSDN